MVERVKEALYRRKRREPDVIKNGRAQRSHRFQRLLHLFSRSRAAPHDPAYFLQVQMSGKHRCRRDDKKNEKTVYLLGSFFHEVSIGAKGYSRHRRAARMSGRSRNSKDVTTPKFPPPPRTAQNRSGFSLPLAVTKLPSARTMSTPSRLSIVRPPLRVR